MVMLNLIMSDRFYTGLSFFLSGGALVQQRGSKRVVRFPEVKTFPTKQKELQLSVSTFYEELIMLIPNTGTL